MLRNVSTAPKPASSSGASNGASPPKQGAFNGAFVRADGKRYIPLDDPVFMSTWQSKVYYSHPDYFFQDAQGYPRVRACYEAQVKSQYIKYRLEKLEANRQLPIILHNGEQVPGENTASARQKRIDTLAGLYCEHPHIERVSDRDLVEAFPPPRKTRDPILAWQKAIFTDHKELFEINGFGDWSVKPAKLDQAKKIYLDKRLQVLDSQYALTQKYVDDWLMHHPDNLFGVVLTSSDRAHLRGYVRLKTLDSALTHAMRFCDNPDDLADEFLIGRIKQYHREDFDHHFATWQRTRPSPAPTVQMEAQLLPPPVTPSAPPLVDASSLEAPLSEREKFLLIKGLVKDSTKDGLQPFLEYTLEPRFAINNPQLYDLIADALACGDDEPVKRLKINDVCKRILKLVRESLASQYFAEQVKPLQNQELRDKFAKAFWEVCAKDQIRLELQRLVSDPNAPPSFQFATAQ